MTSINVMTATGRDVALDETVIEEFSEGLRCRRRYPRGEFRSNQRSPGLRSWRRSQRLGQCHLRRRPEVRS